MQPSDRIRAIVALHMLMHLDYSSTDNQSEKDAAHNLFVQSMVAIGVTTEELEESAHWKADLMDPRNN